MLLRTLMLAAVSPALLGCEEAASEPPPREELPATLPADQADPSPPDQADSSPSAALQVPEQAENSEQPPSSTSWDAVLDLYKKTRGAGEDTWVGAKDSLFEFYATAREGGAGATETTAEWVNAMYQKAKESGQTSATSAKEWVLEDYRAHGTREYKLVPLALEDPAKIEAKLNELGRQRWDCYHVHHDSEGVVLYCKRTRESVLRSLPAKDVLRLFPLLSLGAGSSDVADP